jgi:hypothetical protein
MPSRVRESWFVRHENGLGVGYLPSILQLCLPMSLPREPEHRAGAGKANEQYIDSKLRGSFHPGSYLYILRIAD